MQFAASLPRSRKRQAFLVALSILLAAWGQWALFSHRYVVDGVLLFAAALALFTLTVLRGQRLVDPATGQPPASTERGTRPRLAAALPIIAALALLTWLSSGGNRFRPETVVFWVGSCVVYLWTFWERGTGSSLSLTERLNRFASQGFTVSWTIVGLVLVVLLGAFFRYYQIDMIPAEPTSDHAEKLLDVRDLLSGQYNIFFPRNTGREPLQFYMAIPFVQVFGLTHLALKVEQATVSLLTIPVVYFLGKEIAGSRLGLLAAFFLAVSKWDVGIARIGLRFPLYPFFTALALLFLIRGLRRGSRNDLLICGVVGGIGLYGYSPSRAMVIVIPLVVLIYMAFNWREGREAFRSLVANGALLFGAALLVFLPLGRYMFENPDMFWFRAMSRMSNVEAELPTNPAGVLVTNVLNALLMFNWRGDVVWVNSIPNDPVLDWVSGGLFLLGVGWCLYALIWQRERVAACLLGALFVLLMPSILSLSFPGENPSVVRSGGAGPVVALLVAAPLYLSWRRIAQVRPGGVGRSLGLLAMAVLLVLVAHLNFQRYFVDYSAQYRQNAVNSSDMAEVIDTFSRSVGAQQNAFLKSYPHWVDHRNVAFQIRNPAWNNVLTTVEDILRHQAPPGNKLYLAHKDDQEGVRALQQRFPEGQLRLQQSATPGKEFYVFFVPGR